MARNSEQSGVPTHGERVSPRSAAMTVGGEHTGTTGLDYVIAACHHADVLSGTGSEEVPPLERY